MIESVNLVSILASGVAAMLIGYVWYGPLFGKLWSKEAKVTGSSEDMKGMPKTYGIMFVAALVQACVLAQIIAAFGAVDIMSSIQAAFWTWLGFIAAVRIADVLIEKRSTTLYGINIGYQLVTLVVMSVILVSI